MVTVPVLTGSGLGHRSKGPIAFPFELEAIRQHGHLEGATLVVAFQDRAGQQASHLGSGHFLGDCFARSLPLGLSLWCGKPQVGVVGQFHGPPERPLRQSPLLVGLHPPDDAFDQVLFMPRSSWFAEDLGKLLSQPIHGHPLQLRQLFLNVQHAVLLENRELSGRYPLGTH